MGRIQKFNSVSFFLMVKKLWVLTKSISLNQIFSKKFKYLRHFTKKVQFFESNWAKKKVQFFESHFSKKKKKQSFEWYPRRVVFFQFFECFSKKKKLNTLNHFQKLNSVEPIFKKRLKYWNLMKNSILWVMFKKGSNICLIVPKKSIL